MDVASLLRLNIRRRTGDRVVYADCPICGDRRGKMGLYLELDTWRCWHCGESGGMLPLYGKVHGISNSDAYWEICEALGIENFTEERRAPIYQVRKLSPKDVSSNKAPDEEIHRTLTKMLSLLTLTPAHREHLRTVRGLTDDDIDRFGFKSTPPSRQCHVLTMHMAKLGYRIHGVPGFYVNDYGKWTVKFYTRTSGILIPLCGVDGLLRGLQIRLDHPIRDENDPPDKEGTKYLPLTSSGKKQGVSAGTPVHFIGDPHARVVYVTEGALKADIAHALTGRTFVATVGANNSNGLDELFAFLHRNGTEEIIEAEDMDKYRNAGVNRGAAEVYRLARKNGMTCRRLNWNPNYKGIDDWQLAIRRKRSEKKGSDNMKFKEMYLNGMCPFEYIDGCAEQWRNKPDITVSAWDFLGLTYEEYQLYLQTAPTVSLKEYLDSQRRCQHYRIYQLDLSGGKMVPFAFAGIKKLRESGYEQPPAALYRLVYDSAIFCPIEQSEHDVLERIFARYSDTLPEGFPGRHVALSDVIELYGDNGRTYFYCDVSGFPGVKFSPMLSKSLNTDA